MFNLIPCPFCGGDAQATISSARYCADVVAEVNCSCGTKISRRIMDGSPYDVVEKTFAGIIKQWNNRYHSTSEDQNSEDHSE